MEKLPFALNETMHVAPILVDKGGLSPVQYATAVLQQVMDPEVPVLSLYDLGIIRGVRALDFNTVHVTMTPTYSGCPATVAIEFATEIALLDAGFTTVTLETVLSPPWTTDWISDAGVQKLKEYGIAPPEKGTKKNKGVLFHTDAVRCPRCERDCTQQISQFGSTACKALYTCNACKESFEYFKCI